MARNGFASAMEGFNFGVNAVKQYQDAKLEREAGDAYKNTAPTTATTSDFDKVEQDGLYQGPNSDGVMTNAEAASYGLMEPKKTTTDYTLAGKTQQTQFTDGQIEAARTRAGADVYANAGRMKEASTMRRDAAQLGLTEMQTANMQRETDQGVSMDAKTAAMPTIGGYHKDGAPVDLVARQAAFEADGMSPEEAKAASTSGLRKTTQADQQSYLASVYLAGGHKYLPQYSAAIKSAATERSNQVRRDINKATTVEEMNTAYGHIDDGKSIRSVPQLDAKGKPTGKFQIEAFDTATGQGAGLIQQGKTYDSLDQFKADSNVMMNENPDAFVQHEQAQAQRAMEQAKITEDARKNKANEKLKTEEIGVHRITANATSSAAAASAGLHNAQKTDIEDKTKARKDLEGDLTILGAMTPAELASPEGLALQKTVKIKQAKYSAGADDVTSEFKPSMQGLLGGTAVTKDKKGNMTLTTVDADGNVKSTVKLNKDGSPSAKDLPAGIPPGSKVVGTSGNKAVYEAPDKKRYTVD